MTPASEWEPELIKKSYKDNKVSMLQTLENNAELYYSTLSSDSGISGFNQSMLVEIASNISIEINNIYIMFE